MPAKLSLAMLNQVQRCCASEEARVLQRKNVLLVAHEFPPIGGVGVQRPFKFAQYLPEFGWHPIVLTQVARYSATWDESLLDALSDVPIYRAQDPMTSMQHLLRKEQTTPAQVSQGPKTHEATYINPASPTVKQRVIKMGKRWKDALFIPDETMLWVNHAVRLGLEVVQNHTVSAIYATSPPASSLLVAATLSERTGIPLVIDFRDPWVANLHKKQYGFRHRLDTWLEAYAVVRASRVVTVTDSFCHDFISRYPGQEHKFHVIPNGYDRADLQLDHKVKKDTRVMTIYYGGILYGKRSPKAFLEGLAAALSSGKVPRDKIKVHFAGVFDYPGKHDNLTLVQRLGLTDVVNIIGYVPHHEHATWMAKADVLLLVGDQTQGAGAYVPAKLYEYLGMGRPILTLVQPGEASRLVNECHAGLLGAPDNSADAKRAIEEFFALWQAGDLANWQLSPLAVMYDRKEQSRMLAGQLDAIIHE